ncbi:MAG: nucleotidyltransferase domain-containing protein [Planctomycetes bacterium]|nr:nucleotidyltransferase domain-containing protein [Planctomycetota bacterium]
MGVTYETLQAQRSLRRKQLEQALEEICEKLKNMGALRIIVFGSYVSGIMRKWSDLDIIVVMPSTSSGKEWFKEIYDKINANISADILPFTEEELKIRIKTSSFIRHALKTGRIIYEKRQKN